MNTEIGITYLLSQGGIEGASPIRRSVEACSECVHVGQSVYEPMESMVDGERGKRSLVVRVCRDVRDEAREVARACERALREGDWERTFEPEDDERICSISASAPRYVGLDSNGRHLFEVPVEVIVDRSLP